MKRKISNLFFLNLTSLTIVQIYSKIVFQDLTELVPDICQWDVIQDGWIALTTELQFVNPQPIP
ncbi:MAG: hypothetical protein AAFZ15_01315 [Bacteroidota bacterium]